MALTRRTVMSSLGMNMLLPTAALKSAAPDFSVDCRQIERAAGGRMGAFVLDTGSGRHFGWRADERFCHCSTFKLSLAAAVLREADAGRLALAERLRFGRADIVAYSPVVTAHLDVGELPIETLAEAVQVTSDNAAANVLMRRLGGPAALTGFWREIGDTTSRIDAYEPDVNVIPPGTIRNSTTPRAMAATVRRIVLGDVLSAASRASLLHWMIKTESGRRRVRAALPNGWRAGDKTGTGMRPGVGNKTNDLAVIFPPDGQAPLIVAAYFENPAFSDAVHPADEAALAAVGRLAVAWAR